MTRSSWQSAEAATASLSAGQGIRIATTRMVAAALDFQRAWDKPGRIVEVDQPLGELVEMIRSLRVAMDESKSPSGKIEALYAQKPNI